MSEYQKKNKRNTPKPQIAYTHFNLFGNFRLRIFLGWKGGWGEFILHLGVKSI